MQNIGSYLLANAYSAFSPVVNTAAAVCYSNGQQVPCSAGLVAFGLAIPFIFIAVFVLIIVGVWKVFTKAGQPGWASIIPVYNLVIMLQISKKPIWWVIFSFIPFLNIIFGIIVIYNLAKMFGKGFGFTLGLLFLPFIFYPILGFGDSKYLGIPVMPMQSA